MSERDLETRLDAVERALTDDDTDLTDLREAATLAATVEDLESRVTDLEATVEELDAAVQAVRGYAGNLRAVNRDVERRASAALAKAETLESSLDGRGTLETADGLQDGPDRPDEDRRASGDRKCDDRARDGRPGDGPARDGRPGDGPRRDSRPRDDPTYGDESDADDDGTEQFIQRVREAL